MLNLLIDAFQIVFIIKYFCEIDLDQVLNIHNNYLCNLPQFINHSSH